MTFCNLHVHGEYSLLDGLAKIPDLVSKAKQDGSPALAFTDQGVLYGASCMARSRSTRNV